MVPRQDNPSKQRVNPLYKIIAEGGFVLGPNYTKVKDLIIGKTPSFATCEEMLGSRTYKNQTWRKP